MSIANEGARLCDDQNAKNLETAISKGCGRLFAEKQSWLNSASLRSTWGNDGVNAN